MKRSLFSAIFFVSLFPGTAAAQTDMHKDSLLAEVLTAKEDSNKSVTYLHYGGLFEVSNPDSARYYYTKSWDLAERLNYKRAMGMNISYQIVLLNNAGKFREALAHCERAVGIYKELDSERDLAIAYNNLGNEHQYLGEFRPATEKYLQAASLAEKIRDSVLIRMFSNNVSSVFLTLKDYEKGRQYATTSYKIAVLLRDTFAMASSLVNLASAEAAQGLFDTAMNHVQQVLDYSRVVDDYTLALDGYINTGTIYTSLKQYESALTQLNEALKLARHYKNPTYELVALQGLAETYLAQQQYKVADGVVQRAIQVAIETGSRNELSDLYLKGAAVKEGRADLSAALEYRKKFEALHDTLLNEQVRNNISEIEVRYQTARKDQSIAEQKLALEKNKVSIQKKNIQLTWLLAGVVVLVIIFAASYWFYRQRQKLNEQTIVALQKEQELIRLKALVEGQDAERQRISREMHDDVGSGLTSILYMSQNLISGSPSEAPAIVPKISRTANTLVEKMNEIIWSLNKQFDTLEDLVVYIRHSISELLEDRDIDYQFNVPDVIPQLLITGEQRRNMYLVVKEAVHNAIKHSGATLIAITFQFDKNFTITIHDNGKGFDTNALRRFGNGLTNMKQRMENIRGGFEIKTDNGTSVIASLPLTV